MDSKPSENENSESSDVEECGYSTSTSDESYVEEKEEQRGIKLMHKKELGESSDSDEETVLSFKEHMAAGSDILKAIFTENFQAVIAFLNEHPNGDCGTLHDIAPLHISDALYWACYFGHVKSVKLLEYGANPLKYPTHCYAQGPVVHGACYGGLEVLQTVTEWVLQRRSGCVRRFVNARDRFTNSTALHIATKLQEIDMVIYLMRHGADPCGKDQNHKYPFEYAPAGSQLFGILKSRYMDKFVCDMEKRKSHKKRKTSGRMKESTPPAAGSSNPPAAGNSNPPGSQV